MACLILGLVHICELSLWIRFENGLARPAQFMSPTDSIHDGSGHALVSGISSDSAALILTCIALASLTILRESSIVRCGYRIYNINLADVRLWGSQIPKLSDRGS